MKRIVFILICMLGVLGAFAQDSNKVDANGKKQGIWIKHWEHTGKKKSEGAYKAGKQVGLWRYYYEQGELWIEVEFLADGITANMKMYHGNGKKAAEGLYVNQKKDGKWYYYSIDSVKIGTEQYAKGVKSGTEEAFYLSGKMFEVTTWDKDKKNGMWKQWFENGVTKVDGAYKNDTLEGKVIYYYPNGKKQMEGTYVKGLRSGSFLFYDTSGKMVRTLTYINGKLSPEDEQKYKLEKENNINIPEDIIYQGFEQFKPGNGGY